jgi:hypothetical protein
LESQERPDSEERLFWSQQPNPGSRAHERGLASADAQVVGFSVDATLAGFGLAFSCIWPSSWADAINSDQRPPKRLKIDV